MHNYEDRHLFPVKGIWYCWVYVGSRRVRKTTRCTSKRAARAVRDRLEEQAADPHLAAAQTVTLDDVLYAVLQKRREQAKAGERSTDTAAMYETKNGPLNRILGQDTPVAMLTSEVLDGYVSTRRREQVATPTIYKELSVLRAGLKLAKRHGKWAGDLAIIPALSGESKARERWLQPAELDRLLTELEADHAARAAYCVATGAELRATVRARKADVQAELVKLHGTKRKSREREVPIVTDWQRSLLAYAVKHAKGDLFKLSDNEFRWAVKYAARRAGIDHCTPNDLRRTYSTWLRAAGAGLDSIAPTMGHKDTRQLQRTYARLPTALLAARLAAEMGLDTGRTDKSEQADTGETGETAAPSEKVPRGGIEPPTRGFSVPARLWHTPRELRALSASERSRSDRRRTAHGRVM